MNKFKDAGFVRGVKKEEAEKQEQRRLRRKHEVEDPDVLVVEKSNMGKFLIRTLAALIRFTATAALIVLAATGLVTLIYPEIRKELLLVLGEILLQIRQMTGL